MVKQMIDVRFYSELYNFNMEMCDTIRIIVRTELYCWNYSQLNELKHFTNLNVASTVQLIFDFKTFGRGLRQW